MTDPIHNIIPHPFVTSHRKCEKCGREIRHHGYNKKTEENVCPSEEPLIIKFEKILKRNQPTMGKFPDIDRDYLD